MKELHYRNLALSFLLINVWTLYGLFLHLTDDGFDGMELLLFFLSSSVAGSSYALLMILIRVSLYKKHEEIKRNFLYQIAGVFNFTLSIIWLLAFSTKVLLWKEVDWLLIPANILTATFILIDMYFVGRRVYWEKS